MKLVIATSNKGKVKEFDDALAGLGFELLNASQAGITEFPEETGSSYKENALLKAAHAAEVSGLACLADDSGLEVDALAGAPGLYSARFGGNLGNDKARTAFLLEQLRDVPKDKRFAKFVCCLVLASPSGESKCFYGEAKGEILFGPQGETGFGYDPVFYHDDLKKSFAQASTAEKRQVSHRGSAIKVFKDWLTKDEAKTFFLDNSLILPSGLEVE